MSEKIKRHKRKERTGIVVSDKMDKTRVVQITYVIRHAKYDRRMLKKAKFKIHDEKNESKIGDRVKIAETRPLSKDKRWRLVKILQKASS